MHSKIKPTLDEKYVGFTVDQYENQDSVLASRLWVNTVPWELSLNTPHLCHHQSGIISSGEGDAKCFFLVVFLLIGMSFSLQVLTKALNKSKFWADDGVRFSIKGSTKLFQFILWGHGCLAIYLIIHNLSNSTWKRKCEANASQSENCKSRQSSRWKLTVPCHCCSKWTESYC